MYYYLECWDGEPYNRPTMRDVVERLKSIILKSTMKIYQRKNENIYNIVNQNQITNGNITLNIIENLSSRESLEKGLNMMINKIIEFVTF